MLQYLHYLIPGKLKVLMGVALMKEPGQLVFLRGAALYLEVRLFTMQQLRSCPSFSPNVKSFKSKAIYVETRNFFDYSFYKDSFLKLWLEVCTVFKMSNLIFPGFLKIN